MELNEILSAISTVGFPIAACVVLFIQNNKLRDTVEENTKAVISLTDYIKFSNKEDKK
jgi:hypothetical protein